MTADISQENVARMLARLDAENVPQRPTWVRDQEFIAWAREAVPALAARLAEVEAERDKLFRKAALADEWRDHDKARAEAAETKLAASEAREAKLTEAIIWCSGSDDFQDGGPARDGWLRLCEPLIQPAALQGEAP